MKAEISVRSEIGVWISVISAFSLIPFQSWAMNGEEFQASLHSLKQSQRATESKLMQLGIKVRPSSDSDRSASDLFGSGEKQEKLKPILVIHQDGRSLRAQAGKLLFGKMHNRLLVSGDDVPAIIVLDDGQGIFSGLRALGKAGISGTEGRIGIQVDRIVTRSGMSIPVKGTVEDDAGAYGLEAQVLSSKTLAVVGAMAGSFISGLAASQQTMVPTGFGFQQPQPNGRNGILQGVAQTAADQSKRFIEESTKERPILLAGEGTPVILYLDEEVRF